MSDLMGAFPLGPSYHFDILRPDGIFESVQGLDLSSPVPLTAGHVISCRCVYVCLRVRAWVCCFARVWLLALVCLVCLFVHKAIRLVLLSSVLLVCCLHACLRASVSGHSLSLDRLAEVEGWGWRGSCAELNRRAKACFNLRHFVCLS